MPNWLTRLTGGGSRSADEQKSAQGYVKLSELTGFGDASWSARSFPSLVHHGFARNPVVYRCVRLIAESAAMVPVRARDGAEALSDHPVLRLLRRPNPRMSGMELMEALYAYLQTAGNAYLEAAIADGEIKGLYVLRPDRMQAIAGRTAGRGPIPIPRAGGRRR